MAIESHAFSVNKLSLIHLDVHYTVSTNVDTFNLGEPESGHFLETMGFG